MSLVSSDTTTKYDVRIERNGSLYAEFTQQVETGTSDYLEVDLEEGTYTFTIITDTGSPINFDSGFQLTLIARIDSDYDIQIPDIVRAASNLTANSTGIFLHENMPDVTVLGFLTGLFKMFNLVAEVRNDSPTQKTIVVKTLDDFYSSSLVETDLTSKIDISKSAVNKTLPYTKIMFEYEDTATSAKQHKVNNITWGGEEYEVQGNSRFKRI